MMRAKFVYESLDFERGLDPKKAMGIGGFTLGKLYSKFAKEAELKYEDFLRKNFIGKTVSGRMDSWEGRHGEWKEWTIRVSDIDHNFHGPEFSFVDDKGKKYTVLTDEKVRIIPDIKESQNFERGIHPKQALDVGGICLGEQKFNMKKKLEDDWKFFLLTILDGKTISAQMNKRSENGGKATGKDNWGNYTVTIDDWEIQDIDDWGINIIGTDGDHYILPIDDKKIYIEK